MPPTAKQPTATQASSQQNFPIIATICVFIAFVLLCSLGGWQVQRLAWKNDLLEQLERAYEINPLTTPVSYFDLESASSRGRDITRGYITGTFDYNAEMLVGPRTHKGLSGYHLITPMRLASGQYVLVNRGWVPTAKDTLDKRPESRIDGPVPMGGLFRKPDPATIFTPKNNPARGQWYSINIEEMAAHHRLERVAPLILYVEQIAPQPYNYPLPQQVNKRPNNNHLFYAIFWFGMAGLLLVFYYLRFLRPLFR